MGSPEQRPKHTRGYVHIDMAVRGNSLTKLSADQKLLPPSAGGGVFTFCQGGGCSPSAGTFCCDLLPKPMGRRSDERNLNDEMHEQKQRKPSNHTEHIANAGSGRHLQIGRATRKALKH